MFLKRIGQLFGRKIFDGSLLLEYIIDCPIFFFNSKKVFIYLIFAIIGNLLCLYDDRFNSLFWLDIWVWAIETHQMDRVVTTIL